MLATNKTPHMFHLFSITAKKHVSRTSQQSKQGLPNQLRIGLVAAGLFASTWLPAHAQSLLEMVQSAQNFDALVQASQSQLQASMRKADQARAALLPNAALSAGVTRFNNDISQPPSQRSSTTQSVGVTATQPLYRPANRIGYTQSQRNIDIAQAQLDAANQDLLVRVSQAYFDVLAAQDTLTFVQAQKVAVAEQLASAQRNFEVGTATITDSREAQARYDLVISQEIAAANDLRVKRLALDQLVGITNAQPKPLALPTQLPIVEPQQVSAWVETAQSQQPAIRQAAIALDVASLETEKAKTGHLPTVDLQAGYSVTRNPNGTITAPGINSRTNNASIGVVLNIPLFAGFATENRIKETLALEDQARANLEATKRNVAQSTRAAFFGIESAQGQAKALEAAQASSLSALEANQLGYQVGVRINIDVLNAQSQLYQTKRDLAQARYNVLLGTLRLKQAVGTLTVDDLKPINELLAH